ncbi:hypothetical protein HC251_25180 (plasmid) [Iamia sp. SCSIO 61187]|uniref:hypothetical protein n=1 Tax=Iamia sp. SCSIO 61187 TaxID=2722752 RepID=UPI001C6267E6|nr:hypothetical protein [Iamia sp. SCSIO 61187]QYG95844.1 hypothetical protein HC251_25180 [Iamia sp. SCSIO 61187]
MSQAPALTISFPLSVPEAVDLVAQGLRPRLTLTMRSGVVLWGVAVSVTEALRHLDLPTSVLEAHQVISGGALTEDTIDLRPARLHLVDVLESHGDGTLMARPVAFVPTAEVAGCGYVLDSVGHGELAKALSRPDLGRGSIG